jgi:uncharacterized membrane protein YecN with MAPEG domain
MGWAALARTRARAAAVLLGRFSLNRIERVEVWVLGVLGFEKRFNQLNSNLNLNSSNQKKCTGMNATINSYISLTLF